MATSGKNAGVFRFGPFDFDPATRELRKHGVRLRAPDQSLEILAMLVGCPGELLTREAIRERLWPRGTVVEFEHSVNAAVKRLRDVLSDSASSPRYLETLPKKGYRFIAKVDGSPELPAIRHYRVFEELGRGGMGLVYRAEDLRLGRQVAIKMLPSESAVDPQRRARFLREARAVSALNHPNIVTLYEMGSENGLDFMVMEYVAGKPLAQIIPPMGMKATEAIRLAIQIAGALSAAHAAGIIHRDLKPGNILVDAQGNAKLFDFGVANITAIPVTEHATGPPVPDCSADDAAAGTAEYMSPEQAEGKPVDQRSDVFSFGTVLYEMITGQHPFERGSNSSTLDSILHEKPPPPRQLSPAIPPDLEHTVLRCLAKSPADRFQSMDNVIRALEVRPTALDPSRTDLPKASWKLALLSGVAALGILSAAIVSLLSSRQGPSPDLAGVVLTPAGSASSPSFSPDGNRIAFSWNGDKQDNADIYVRQIGPNAVPLRLTSDPALDVAPVWSPDDRYIAFVRQGRESGDVFVISPLGGREHKIPGVQVDANPIYDAHPISWTPDSKWIAASVRAEGGQSSSIWLFPLESGEPRRLTTPTPGSSGDHYPSISPDGRTLVFARSLHEWVPSLWRLRLTREFHADGEPSLLFDVRNSRIWGLAWTADSREVIYSAGEIPESRLFRSSASGASAPVVLAAPAGAAFPAINGVRRRLAYILARGQSEFWRVDMRTGQRQLLIRMGGINQQYSPDGRRIAWVRTRSGHTGIWTCDADGTGCGELASLGTAVGGSPQWSPDGQWIAADSRMEGQSEIYLIPADGGALRRFTAHPADDFLPTWSRDGAWIYFASNRSGRNEIWRMRATGTGGAVQLTRTGGLIAFESVDRKYLYYLRNVMHAPKLLGRHMCELLRMPVEGGKTELVLPRVQDYDEIAVMADAIFFSSDLNSIQRLSLSTGKITTVLNEPYRSSLCVSPDEKFLLLQAHRGGSSDLILVEGFR